MRVSFLLKKKSHSQHKTLLLLFIAKLRTPASFKSENHAESSRQLKEKTGLLRTLTGIEGRRHGGPSSVCPAALLPARLPDEELAWLSSVSLTEKEPILASPGSKLASLNHERSSLFMECLLLDVISLEVKTLVAPLLKDVSLVGARGQPPLLETTTARSSPRFRRGTIGPVRSCCACLMPCSEDCRSSSYSVAGLHGAMAGLRKLCAGEVYHRRSISSDGCLVVKL